MAVTVSAMFIPVHDPDAALGFYRDALGLEVRNDVASDGFRWVTVGAPGQDVDIVLFQPHGGRSQAEGDALLALVTQGSLQAAIFRSDDLDTTFEKVRASGAEVLQEPASQPWGAARLRVPRPLGQPRPHRAGLNVVRQERRAHFGLADHHPRTCRGDPLADAVLSRSGRSGQIRRIWSSRRATSFTSERSASRHERLHTRMDVDLTPMDEAATRRWLDRVAPPTSPI